MKVILIAELRIADFVEFRNKKLKQSEIRNPKSEIQ